MRCWRESRSAFPNYSRSVIGQRYIGSGGVTYVIRSLYRIRQASKVHCPAWCACFGVAKVRSLLYLRPLLERYTAKHRRTSFHDGATDWLIIDPATQQTLSNKQQYSSTTHRLERRRTDSGRRPPRSRPSARRTGYHGCAATAPATAVIPTTSHGGSRQRTNSPNAARARAKSSGRLTVLVHTGL